MANPVGTKQPTPAPVTPNAALTTAQKNAHLALQTARAKFESSGISVYIAESNELLAAIDAALLAWV